MLNTPHLSRVDLNLLVLFDAVMAECHVGRAARRLNLTASAVSHGLRRLRPLLEDPLFLRTPKGVVPTARATELAAPVADILARVRSVIATAEPFDPAKSSRRFIVGAPDGSAAVFLPSLLRAVGRVAPGIDIGLRQLLPPPRAATAAQAWEHALAELESRALDVAVLPLGEVPARFVKRTLYDEDFVIASRVGHPFVRNPTLDRFCAARHLVVSIGGDARGFVDNILARKGRARRVTLTVPNFMLALAAIAESDLIAALPRQLVARHAARFGLATTEPPWPLLSAPIRAVTTKAAMLDAGVAWLFEMLSTSVPAADRPRLSRRRWRRR